MQLLSLELGRDAATVAGTVKKYPFCEQSDAQALAWHEQKSADRVANASGKGAIGGILLGVGGLQLRIGLGSTIAAGLAYFGLFSNWGLPRDLGTAIFPVGSVLSVVGIGLVIKGLEDKRQFARDRFIRLHGKPATAVIVDCSHTGTKLNNVPQWEMRMSVTLPGQAPYEAFKRVLLDYRTVANMRGMTVNVWVHPDNPAEVVVQLP